MNFFNIFPNEIIWLIFKYLDVFLKFPSYNCYTWAFNYKLDNIMRWLENVNFPFYICLNGKKICIISPCIINYQLQLMNQFYCRFNKSEC